MLTDNYGEDIPYIETSEIQDPNIKADIWKTAIGLQKVDGLTPSDKLLDLADQNIYNKTSYQQIDEQIKTYYQSAPAKEAKEHREADIVSLHIAQLLESGRSTEFSLNKKTLAKIHMSLFADVFEDELIIGRFRKVNITKKEAVLYGDTVKYGEESSIPFALDIAFAEEAEYRYSGLSSGEATPDDIKRLVDFTSEIWQIHPFREGNTRTTATFIELYLQSLGLSDINNEPFKQNSLYFRNALVRNCYSNLKRGILAEPVYLSRFFENLLCGKQNKLDNKDLYLNVGPVLE